MSSILAVFQDQGLVYLARSRVNDVRVQAYDWTQSPYALANQAEFERLTQRYGPQIRRGERAALELRPVDRDVGLGVFALAALKPDDLVGEYAGVIQAVTDAPATMMSNGHYLSDYSWNYPDELPDGSEFEVNAFSEGNELRFVNHSFRPNCAVDHTLVDGLFVTFFRAISAVAAGDQLLVDYGEAYWSGGYRSLVSL